jgi:multidrug efflux system membrane fusion protein
MNNRRKIQIIIICFIALIIALIKSNNHSVMQKLPSAEFEYVKRQDMPYILELAGTVEAFQTVEIKSRVDGQITKINFKEGQTVKKGDLLFEIDSRKYENELNQAEANLKRDEAQLVNLEATVERYSKLLKNQTVTRDAYQTAVASRDSMQASIKSDQAAIKNAKLNIEYCKITAPIDGVTSEISFQEGSLVKANDAVSLTTINQIDPVYLSFSVPEDYITDLIKARDNDKTTVLAIDPDKKNKVIATGKLVFVDNKIDKNTGTVEAKAIFEKNNKNLWPGQFLKVKLDIFTKHNALIIPVNAIQENMNGKYVFVINKDDEVVIKNIKVEFNNGKDTVICKGLEEGERVVTYGHLRLSPNMKVKPVKGK